ncbi:hypothetical protein P9D43_27120 [Neobacillus niacini]|uniref:hypothetical protein n=1 Tax=Neobacillus niacini TaxID=86668 RepID=UPI0007AB22E8|nr:hypothetical protein [Neobacillus niacini]MEC1525679.1 hypothetical protein [Neobacillus niacini]
MYYFNYYFRFINILMLTFVVAFPIFGFALFLFFKPHTEYQLYFEGKFLAYFAIFLICLFISRLLNNLWHEKAPSNIIHILWIGVLTMLLIFSSLFGLMMMKQYFTAFQDDLPVQTKSTLAEVIPIEEKFFGPIDNSLYGQIPYDAHGNMHRYGIQLIDTNHQVYQTAYFDSKHDYTFTLEKLKGEIGNTLIMDLFPKSKRIVSIEVPTESGPFYENEFLTKGEEGSF